MEIGTGIFTGHESYDGRLKGSFMLEVEGDRIRFTTSEDFRFAGTPSPGFALAPDSITEIPGDEQKRIAESTRFLDLPNSGSTDPDMQLEVVGSYTGLLPEGIEIDQIDNVILWCFQFPTLLGTGPIER